MGKKITARKRAKIKEEIVFHIVASIFIAVIPITLLIIAGIFQNITTKLLLGIYLMLAGVVFGILLIFFAIKGKFGFGQEGLFYDKYKL